MPCSKYICTKITLYKWKLFFEEILLPKVFNQIYALEKQLYEQYSPDVISYILRSYGWKIFPRGSIHMHPYSYSTHRYAYSTKVMKYYS